MPNRKMIEKVYTLYQGNEKKIEKIVMENRGHYLHMVFPKNEGLPIHMSNADLFMTVMRGTLTLGLINRTKLMSTTNLLLINFFILTNLYKILSNLE